MIPHVRQEMFHRPEQIRTETAPFGIYGIESTAGEQA